MSPQPARPSILDDIIATKRREVALLKAGADLKNLKALVPDLPPTRDLRKALPKGKLSLIAELKKASPSAGLIAERFEPVTLAKTCEESGAAALSVLTDATYFQGQLAYLKAAKDSTTIPVLRKDFIIDEAQLYESRVAGADAILLIAAVLSDSQLKDYLALARSLSLHCLVEIHNGGEAARVLKLEAPLIGINNRDLTDFRIDFQTTLNLLESFPALKERIIVSESGIASAEQVRQLHAAGVSAILVGTSLMKSQDIGAKIKELLQ